MNRIDPDGRDWKKLSDWVRFAKNIYHACTAMVTVGLQVAVQAKVASKPIGITLNAASVDIIGVRSGKFTPNQNTPLIKKEAEIGVGVVGASYSKTVKDNGQTQTVETKTSAGTILTQVEHTTTKEVVETQNGNYQTLRSNSETSIKVPDIQIKGAALVGVELSVDPNKVWTAFSHLMNDQ
jgi:multisubunit Na+/H+ antiporter MnhC subunit